MGKKKSKTLIEAIHQEMNRCRESIKECDLIPMGFLWSSVIQQVIIMAEKAIEEDDAIKILVAYERLKKV